MRQRSVHAVLGTAFLALAIAFAAGVGPARAGRSRPDEKAIIEKVIRDNIGWALTKDRALAESTMVHDESLFIFNPTSESTTGWSQLVKNFDFWLDPRFKATKCEIWDLRIGVSQSGDAAWWSGMLNDLAEWDGKPTGWKDTRWSGVMEKRDGKWLIVQMHFSFAADKVAAQVKAKLEAQKSGPGRAATPVSLPPMGEAAGPLTLTYVANMGVLVSRGETKVLIDVLFDKPNPDYRAPAPETLDKIMNGAAPFDGVDLVLVTHNHPDHFDPGLAVRYLEARPEALLAAPADAVEAMRRAAADWAKIGPRVVPIDLKVGQKETRNLRGLTVTACRTLHSGELDSPMNLMYLIDLDGRRIWHEGDTTGKPDVFQAFGLDKTPVDLAVVHFWLPLEPNAARFLQEDLKAGHIALAHLPVRLEGDAPGKIDLVRAYYKDLFLLLPGTPAKEFVK